MKTANTIIILIVAMLIVNDCKADLIDNYTDRQLISDYAEPYITSKHSTRQLLVNSELGNIDRTFRINMPSIKNSATYLFVSAGKMIINSLEPGAIAAIIYDFNNANLSAYDGILINKACGGSGQLRIVASGPGGISKSAKLDMASEQIYVSLGEFSDSYLFININRIKLIFGNARYNGRLAVELIK